jgi:ribosomal protein L10
MDPFADPTTPTPEPSPEPSGFLKGRKVPAAILASGAAFAMTLAGLGIANAQTGDSTPPPSSTTAPADGPRDHGPGPGHRGPKADLKVAADAIGITPQELRTGLEAGKSIAAIAGEHNVDAQKVIDAMVADAKAHLAQAVTDGKLTQAEADQRSADLEARITKLVNSTPPARPDGGFKRGPRPGMMGGLDAAAGAIGISVDELRSGLASGKSLAAIAGEHGVDAAKVGDAIVADAKSHLDQAVAAGKLTQAEADQRLADLQSHVGDLLNRTGPPAGGPGHHGPHGPMGGPDGDGPPPAQAPADGPGAQPAVYTA